MAELKNRIENGLNEARILLLGGQVLLGFLLRAYFEPRFKQLSHEGALVLCAATVVLTATLGLLIWPAPFHQIARRGAQTPDLDLFTTRILDWALAPLAISTGLSLYPVIQMVGIPDAWLFTSMSIVAALGLWYGLALVRHDPVRRRNAREETQKQRQQDARQGKSDLPDRIKNVLVECRMALPGAQALVGFQFVDVFFSSFEELPRSLQLVHLASLLCSLVATLLLIAPAAYHRIAEAGEETEHFLNVASRFLLASLVFLAPGMTGDIFVVLTRVTHSFMLGAGVSLFLLILFYAMWFVYSALARQKR